MFTLSSITYLDKQTKEYNDIIIINKRPPSDNPLNKRIRQIKPPLLSPFKGHNRHTKSCNYVYAITRPEPDKFELMTPSEIPELFSFLIETGFTINTNVTQMMQMSNVQMDNNLLCFITL